MAALFCKKCLLRDGAEADLKMLDKYISVIKPKDRAAESVQESRLRICRSCESLLDATCQACGCYVEFRAAAKISRCPRKKW